MASFDHNSGWQQREVAARYDSKRFKSWTGRAFDSMEKRVISNFLGVAFENMNGKCVLDLPSGTGRIAELLVQEECHVTCGDISKEMLQVAKQRLEPYPGRVENFEVLDIYNIDKPSASFDLVTCIRLFQHLDTDQRARALKELARVSRRFVLVNVMYTSLYYGLIRMARKAVGAYAPRHTTSRVELEQEITSAGLKKRAARFSQPLYGGNLVLLLEKE